MGNVISKLVLFYFAIFENSSTDNKSEPAKHLADNQKNTPFCGVFYTLHQKMVEHVKTYNRSSLPN